MVTAAQAQPLSFTSDRQQLSRQHNFSVSYSLDVGPGESPDIHP